MEYAFDTEVAKFVIRTEPLGMWDLWVNDMPTITFATPDEAARAVYEQDTGFFDWDQLEEHNAPETLAGWVERP